MYANRGDRYEVKNNSWSQCLPLNAGWVRYGRGGGIQSNYIDGSYAPSERRAALKTVLQISDSDARYVKIGSVGGRRCHRNFLEEQPSDDVLLSDIKVAAYSQGGDAIGEMSTEKVPGLVANCWYVLEGKASIYKHK